jgi:ABC-2 type transport system ATP-binding protein
MTTECADRVGYMPEERGLYRRMKVREVLAFFGGLKNGNGIKQRVDAWLERMDLTGWADKKVETLSKGMAQKVQFIATVVSEPELVLLDEPFTGLDPVNTEVLKDALLQLRDAGTTVIFSTHDMAMAERLCDFIFMIYRGKKVLDGTLAEIQGAYDCDTIRVRPADPATRLDSLNGVQRINNSGNVQELQLSPGGDPQEVLRQILTRTPLLSFDIVKPSLHDIFVRIARPESKEAEHA